MRRLLFVAVATLLAGGCGYFNSLYNANRRFAEAERAVRSGDVEGANRAYREAIAGAAVSYRRHPDSRWADDALLVVGRSRFALGENAAAAAAMEALLAQSTDVQMRAAAQSWLGAARFRLGDAAAAAAPLDSALTTLEPGSGHAAFARLWRARVRFDQSRADAWDDLTHAAHARSTAWEASLEGIRRAAAARDSAQLERFMNTLADARFVPGAFFQVDTTLRSAAAAWSPAAVFRASAPLQLGAWPAAGRDAAGIVRVELARAAGSNDAAFRIAMDIAEAVGGGVGSTARFHAARLRLTEAAAPEDLEQIRIILLRAFDSSDALQLMRLVRTAQVLIEQGDGPATALSLFAAAEMARDELQAPLLAQRLFLDFAALQPDNVWAGKAVLAAHDIAPSEETSAALRLHAANAYVRTAQGAAADDAVDRAEERMAWGIAGLRADAFTEAILRDAVVGRAVTMLDSTRAAARSDSVRIACGTLLDSLRLTGIRSDSTRSACLRGDSARVAFVLTADTLLLRDTTRAGDPRTIRRLPGQAAPDTFDLR
jgi:hypothetical protein